MVTGTAWLWGGSNDWQEVPQASSLRPLLLMPFMMSERLHLQQLLWRISTPVTEALWGTQCWCDGHGHAPPRSPLRRSCHPAARSMADRWLPAVGFSRASLSQLESHSAHDVPSWHSLHLVTEQGSRVKPRHANGQCCLRAPPWAGQGYVGHALQFNIFFCPILLLPPSFDRHLFVL